MPIDKNKQFPVECLNESIIDVINNTNDFISSIKDECMYNGLSPFILYKRDNHNFNDSGEIKTTDNKNYISIGVGYCQYLWAVGLYLTYYFDNYIQPRNNGNKIDIDEQEKEFVVSTFKNAIDMVNSNTYNTNIFWNTPNILENDGFEKNIGIANGLYCGAIAFIIAHEVSHHYLGHLENDEYDENVLKKEEIDADNLAINFLLNYKEWKDNFRVGICSVFASLLLINSESVNGDKSHPDLDCRIKNFIEELDLAESDIIWGYMGCAIYLWLHNYTNYKGDGESESCVHLLTYKEFFYYYLNKLTEYKNAFM